MLRAEPFSVRLAGNTIEVQPQYAETRTFCGAYLSDGKADFSVCITPEDIVFEQEKAMRQDAKEGRGIQRYSAEYLETLALYRKIADRLAERQILLMHGSAISVDGQGYLFAAPSGTGKSTHTRFWREFLGERAIMINDDKPLVSVNKSGAYVHGTPWCGKHGLHTDLSVPLRAICILSRGHTDHIRPITGREAMSMLLQQTYRPRNTEGLYAVLSSIGLLAEAVGLYRMECTMNPAAAQIAFAAMSPKR